MEELNHILQQKMGTNQKKVKMQELTKADLLWAVILIDLLHDATMYYSVNISLLNDLTLLFLLEY